MSKSTSECGSCNLCCKFTEIAELHKPINELCKHCKPEIGCSIYEDRPESCKKFECMWLAENWVHELRPDLSHVMFETIPGSNTYVGLIDPKYKSTWLTDTLDNKMQDIKSNGNPVVIRTGKNVNILVPESMDASVIWQELKEAFRRL